MKKNDDFTNQIIQKFEKLAQEHKDKNTIMNQVLDHVHHERHRRHNIWKMTSFALAATLAGFLILPNALNMHSKQQPQQVIVNTNSNKLSPQMMEDLEMVMVFGEDKNTHGS